MSTLSTRCGMQGILVVTQSDPIAQDAMLELLLPRLSQLYETDKAQPPVKLGTCVSEQVCCYSTFVAAEISVDTHAAQSKGFVSFH